MAVQAYAIIYLENLQIIMLANILPYILKIAATFFFLAKSQFKISFATFLKDICPPPHLLVMFPCAFLACRTIMKAQKKELLGFAMCGALGGVHLVIFAFLMKNKALEIKRLLSEEQKLTQDATVDSNEKNGKEKVD